MLDIKFIRENKDLIKLAAKKKHVSFDVDDLIKIDDDRLKRLLDVENLRATQNKVSQDVASAADPSARQSLIDKMKIVKSDLQRKEDELKDLMVKWRALMLQVPNVPDVSVPDGESDADNKEVRTWGDIPKFDFQPKNHADLMLALDMVDFERGSKVAGFRGYFLKGAAVELCLALWQFTMEQVSKKGYQPFIAPILDRKEAFFGTGYLPQFEEDLYKTQADSYLAGTAEVPMMAYYMDEVLPKEKLPLKMIAFSPCYRLEAGAHGKDTRGLIRLHEFFKLEQLILCEADHQTSVAFHEELTANAEALVQALGIPYHVVVNCGADIGLGQVKKYDIECWVPTEGKYRETHSASYFHDFQTRRLNIRYKDEAGKMHFAHSLNNTALATPRILVPLIECYQNADGSIRVPEVLQKYMGKSVISKQG
ncbi:MAG: serine--tRNA ligase [Candidatus Paceibacterota bacterium]|jgi:seryl-tRNA synthetase